MIGQNEAHSFMMTQGLGISVSISPSLIATLNSAKNAALAPNKPILRGLHWRLQKGD